MDRLCLQLRGREKMKINNHCFSWYKENLFLVTCKLSWSYSTRTVKAIDESYLLNRSLWIFLPIR